MRPYLHEGVISDPLTVLDFLAELRYRDRMTTQDKVRKPTRDELPATVAMIPAREWIIQRCINAFRNEYEDWPGYCERLQTREEMLVALRECDRRWPEHEFRGHNVANQRPGRDLLRPVQ
jgi:hypothetical protein